MKKISSAVFSIALAFVSPSLFAQQEVAMADTLRSEGKIYVVVSIMVLIFAGLACYLFLIDRKVSRLEKQIQDKKL